MERQPVDTLAIVSLIAGILSVMYAWFSPQAPSFGIAVPAGIAAIATGVMVLRRAAEGRGLAVTGIILGTLAVGTWVVLHIGRATLALIHWIF